MKRIQDESHSQYFDFLRMRKLSYDRNPSKQNENDPRWRTTGLSYVDIILLFCTRVVLSTWITLVRQFANQKVKSL